MGLLAWRQFAPGRAARIEQFFPAHLPGPVLQALHVNTARLVIMKIVRDPVRIQPSKRLFHGVALLDAVELWHGAEVSRYRKSGNAVAVCDMECCSSALQREDFSRIQNVLRVQGSLDFAHDPDRLTVFGDQKLLFAKSDAVFPSARPVHRQRPHYQAVVQTLGLLEFLRIVTVDQKAEVEVAVSDMSDQGGDQETACQ